MSTRYKISVVVLSFILGITFAFMALNSQASTFPERPIRIVLGMPASSTFPIISKAITDNVPNKSFVFVNDHKVGQGNLIASQYAATNKPDGYTILFASTSLTINPSLYKDAGYSVDQFEPLIYIGKVDNALMVHPSVPFRNVKDLLTYATKNPAKLMYGHNGFATQSFLAMELLSIVSKTKFTQIPYANRGTDSAILDLFRGEIDIHIPVIARAVGYAQTGKARILATTGLNRSTLTPSIPTVSETVKGFESFIWYALVVKADTPRHIKAALTNQLLSGIQSESAKRILQNTGVEQFAKSPASDFMVREQAKWSSIIVARGIKPE